jgi:adenylate cyclase
VFAVQDEIAKSIVAALEISLSPAQERSIKKLASTQDMDAYDFYLRGRYFVERGDVDSGQGMFEKAIELDDGYALAWAGTADCHSWRCMWYEGSPESQLLADQYSLKALQLAPDLAQAHASRSYALTINGKYTEAEGEFKAAIGLDPQLYEAYYYAGRAYFAQGKFREAVDAFSQAAAIRPDDVTAAALTSTSTRALGDSEDWKKACRHSIEVAEKHLLLNPDDALARSRVANDLIALGETEKGLEYAERAYSIGPNNCRYNVACANMVAGNTERALDLLEEHARSGGVHADWLEQDVDWEAVCELPRFKAILEIARYGELKSPD